jgi:hypothetical protein
VARWPKPVEGSWTEHYPELGTGLVRYEDSISPEIYELERAAIFARAWLNVGRVDRAADIRISEKAHGPAGARRYEYSRIYLLRGLERLHLEFTPIG